MIPFEAKKLPIDYNLDKNMLILLSEANERYGEYSTLIKNTGFDSKLFLDSLILSESLKSTQIEGTQISQDEMYYLKYMEQTDDSIEVQNLKKVINYSSDQINNGKNIDIQFVNNMHKILLNSVRGSNKAPGEIRTIQNWIGPKGCTMEDADFVPPIPENVPILLDNLYNYMNDKFVDPLFINLAISHAQFETIHAYRDGNGRLGRALIPIELASLTNEEPILFLSEIIEIYKPAYQRGLMDYRNGNVSGFIKFFLQCIIEQLNAYIYKINKIKSIYLDDLNTIKQIKGSSIYKIMPSILKQVVFTKKEIEIDSGVSKNVVSDKINKLVNLGILVKDETYNKKAYKYKKVYNIFIGKSN